MIDDMIDALCKELFCFVVVVVVVVVISFLWYYLHELSPENFAIYISIYIYNIYIDIYIIYIIQYKVAYQIESNTLQMRVTKLQFMSC